MKSKLSIFTACIGLMFSISAFSQELFSEGLSDYNTKNYAGAIDHFTQIIEKDSSNVSAWFNLGMSNLGLHKYGQSIYCFEKVLTFEPNDNEAKEKLTIAFSELYPNQIYEPRLGNLKSGLYSIKSNNWAYLSIFFSVLFLVCVIVYLKLKRPSLKNSLITTASLVLLLLIGSIYLAKDVANYHSSNSYAIVTKKSIPTFIEKGKTAKKTITEGIRVKIINHNNNGFCTVETLNGERHLVLFKDLSWI